uniref:Big defensin n=1 Tax=Anadara broughtonii TaxID=148819 RepID=V5IYZ4_ANABR|nr:big defensin [Anadara broughtonii]
MTHKIVLCCIYLLLSTSFILSKQLPEERKQKEKKQLLLAAGAGVALSELLGPVLVGAGTLAGTALLNQVVSSHSHSSSQISVSNRWVIPCANNRGWCRTDCHDGEHIDDYHSDICHSGYKCCRY